MRLGWTFALLVVASSPVLADARKPPVAEPAPRSLFERAGQHEAKQEWAAARDVYAKLGSIAGYRKQALYHQARMAHLLFDHEAALVLVKHALAEGAGAYHFEAKVLYGDILFSQGHYHRAKLLFLTLRQAATTNRVKAALANKVKAANRALRLAERDGL